MIEARGKKREQMLKVISNNLLTLRMKNYPGRGGSKQCATAMNLTLQQWSAWENGSRLPNNARLAQISEFFGVSMDYLKTDHSGGQYYDEPEAMPEPVHEVAHAPAESTVTRSIKRQLRASAMQLQNIQAVLHVEFSIVDVEFKS